MSRRRIKAIFFSGLGMLVIAFMTAFFSIWVSDSDFSGNLVNTAFLFAVGGVVTCIISGVCLDD